MEVNPIVSKIIENYKVTGVWQTDDYWDLGPYDRAIIINFVKEVGKRRVDKARKEAPWMNMLTIDYYVEDEECDLVVWKNCRIFDI
jgi:hypothetical protein